MAKCADCHSNETRWPIYARIAPGSWLIERDIIDARKHMDLSQWKSTPAETQQVWTAKIVQEAKSGDMPPPQYLLLHWDAQAFQGRCAGAFSPWASPRVAARPPLPDRAIQLNGQAVFNKRCTGCHALGR